MWVETLVWEPNPITCGLAAAGTDRLGATPDTPQADNVETLSQLSITLSAARLHIAPLMCSPTIKDSLFKRESTAHV
jgi:hypothetical protein